MLACIHAFWISGGDETKSMIIQSVIHSFICTHSRLECSKMVLVWWLVREMIQDDAWQGMANQARHGSYPPQHGIFVEPSLTLQSNFGGQQISITRVSFPRSPFPYMRCRDIAHPYRVINYGDGWRRRNCKSRWWSLALWRRSSCRWDTCWCVRMTAELKIIRWSLGRSTSSRMLLSNLTFKCA